MAAYCFASPEERHALFTDVCLQGWLAAILDFPQLKSREEGQERTPAVCAARRSEVCCIPAGLAYDRLVSSAWLASYTATEPVSERQLAQFVVALKGLPEAEAMAVLRSAAKASDAQAVIDDAYQQFIDRKPPEE